MTIKSPHSTANAASEHTRGAISLEEVRHVARLARLHVGEGELKAMQSQLDSILHFMAAMNEVSVDGVEPTTHAVPVRLRLQDDRLQPSLHRSEVLQAAPASRDGGFAVPKVLEGK
jgi:aspartyl-tRNA(Asn)/glutamyl-tRNA(Gln) amidotransferase subunit C